MRSVEARGGGLEQAKEEEGDLQDVDVRMRISGRPGRR